MRKIELLIVILVMIASFILGGGLALRFNDRILPIPDDFGGVPTASWYYPTITSTSPNEKYRATSVEDHRGILVFDRYFDLYVQSQVEPKSRKKGNVLDLWIGNNGGSCVLSVI